MDNQAQNATVPNTQSWGQYKHIKHCKKTQNKPLESGEEIGINIFHPATSHRHTHPDDIIQIFLLPTPVIIIHEPRLSYKVTISVLQMFVSRAPSYLPQEDITKKGRRIKTEYR
jgi:2,4-dienoyl-CoA reductase-like NADH-dependent reductase (Old Yellow Enzyme family)